LISLKLPTESTARLTVLCIGAHSDDIEIGCGGTVLKLADEFPKCEFHWVVFNATGVRETEARKGAELFAGPKGLKSTVLKGFRDGFMPFVGGEVKAVFEELKSISPDLIFTHNRRDAHQDHRLLAELTWNTFRNHMILEYEIPKYDGDMGQPNFFVPLSSDQYQKKVRNIIDTFKSQHGKHWFREETFAGLMRIRGMECNAESGYAEAFYVRKAVL
jgi:LmbE family N-acetylglucosaminyl deacetylase